MSGPLDPEDCLCAGPWCFAGQEEKFPGWEDAYTFAPEPLADKTRLEAAAKTAKALCLRIIPQIAARLEANAAGFSPVYWQELLAPWAIRVASLVTEKALRCQAMLAAWGHERLTCALAAPEAEFNFQDEHDFEMRGSLGPAFNFWLLSRLLEFQWPADWQKSSARLEIPKPAGAGSQSALKNLARKLNLALPFPKLRGMSPKQALLFSLALWHTLQTGIRGQSLAEEYGREDLPGYLPPLEKILPLFLTAIPQSLKSLKHWSIPAKKGKPFLRVAGIAAYEDAAYRQSLARWKASGNELAFCQHGGNYGQAAVVCDTSLVEYSQAAFFTWGWQKHGRLKGNFIPLPSPHLSGMADSWTGGADTLLYVGAEMAAYAYRLDSRPTPLEFIQYRRDKAAFFNALDSKILSHTLYRPYFPLPGVLEDGDWVLRRFPQIKICRGSLGEHLRRTRLLVIDHHGTTMLEAFSANVPLLLFWNRKLWPLDPEAEKLLELLAEAGIWQPTPEACAKKAAEVWEDPAGWWQGAAIQEARLEYCGRQALFDKKDPDSAWIQTLKAL